MRADTSKKVVDVTSNASRSVSYYPEFSLHNVLALDVLPIFIAEGKVR